jgi:hypothetical protein
MKKLIIGLAAIGAVLAVRPLVKRKAQTMRERCEQMAGKCKEKMALLGSEGERGEKRQRCKERIAEGTKATPDEEAAVAKPPQPTSEALASA